MLMGMSENWRDLILFGVRVGQIGGITIRLHLLLILFAVIHALSSMGNLLTFLVIGLGLPVILFGSVLLHELGHCYGAWIVRGGAREIILWPLGGLAEVEGANRSPENELLVTLLGPAVNLVLAALAWAILVLMRLLPEGVMLHPAGFAATSLVQMALGINLILLIFNMVMPILPMDCARVLRATLVLRGMHPASATMLMCKIGIWVAIVGFVLSLFAPDALAGFGVRLGPIFGIICIMGVFSCMQQMMLVRLGMPVYTSYMSYGMGRGFYTATSNDWRPWGPRVWFNDLWHFLVRSRRSGRKAGLGRVVEITPNAVPETARTKYLRQLRELEDQLRDAVRREDFTRASSLKKRIADMKANPPAETG